MERQSHNKMGESGFYHFYGVVENRKDPLRRGRVQVRIFGDHTEDLAELPTDALAWAQIVLPVTSTPNSSHNLWDGTLVTGYYADGIEKQVPIITGQLAKNGETTIDAPGVKTHGFIDQREVKDCSTSDGSTCASVGINTSPVANPDMYNQSIMKKTRNATKHKINGAKEFDYEEPSDSYKSQYPFNRASETESGHIIEYDDTPGNERINISHRTGSYVEMLKDGSVVYKTVADTHNITNGNSVNSTSGSSSNNVSGVSINQVGGNYILNVAGDANITVGGNVTQSVGGSYSGSFGGSYNVTAGTINMSAGTINLN